MKRKIKGYEDKVLPMSDEDKKKLKKYWTDVAKGLINTDEKEDTQ